MYIESLNSYLMRKIVYYVAVSVDGYIEGPNNATDKYIHEKTIVDHYMNDLKNYDINY